MNELLCWSAELAKHCITLAKNVNELIQLKIRVERMRIDHMRSAGFREEKES